MSNFARSFIVIFIGCCAHAEMRTWTNTSGKTVDGQYASILFDNVVIKDAEGKEIKLPMDSLSKEDLEYVELVNPPKLKVDFLESAPVTQVDAIPWHSNSGQVFNTDPVFVVDAQFGARITQKSNKPYNHKLTVEMFTLAKQVYDPDKYHYIAHSKSAPFILSTTNNRRYEYIEEKKHVLMYYNYGGTQPRGEKIAETLVLVRDQRGEIIAYNSTKKWLFDNYHKLQKLPQGAWLDKTCTQVYPTSPVYW